MRECINTCKKCNQLYVSPSPARKYCSEKCFLEAVLLPKPSDENACWLWGGPIAKHGKGIVYGDYSFQGIKLAAHVWSYKTFVGEIKKGLVIRHKCRNTTCINPKHLEIGTQGDNCRDKFRDGTANVGGVNPKIQGEKNKRALLTNAQALEIFHSDLSCTELAEKFNCSYTIPWFVRNGYSWNSITGLPKTPRRNKKGP